MPPQPTSTGHQDDQPLADDIQETDARNLLPHLSRLTLPAAKPGIRGGKFRNKGVKREHHQLEGAEEILDTLARMPGVSCVTPGRMRKGGRGQPSRLTLQYKTPAGVKLLLRFGGVIQEIFLVAHAPDALHILLLQTLNSNAEAPDPDKQKNRGK